MQVGTEDADPRRPAPGSSAWASPIRRAVTGMWMPRCSAGAEPQAPPARTTSGASMRPMEVRTPVTVPAVSSTFRARMPSEGETPSR